MNFSEALVLLKQGKKVKRKGWNGKGMFLYLISGVEFQKAFQYGYGEYEGEPTFSQSIAIKTAQNTIVVGWKPSNPDMFENDWEVVGNDLDNIKGTYFEPKEDDVILPDENVLCVGVDRIESRPFGIVVTGEAERGNVKKKFVVKLEPHSWRYESMTAIEDYLQKNLPSLGLDI